MFASVFRRRTKDVVEVIPDNSGPYHATTDGSLLLVDEGNVAFCRINGLLSPPYSPGRYEILSGVDPFFVRVKNILTRGDTGTSVSIIFVAVDKITNYMGGTGELPIIADFGLTVNAFAAFNMTFSISDPEKFVKHIVGAYSNGFSMDEFNPFVDQSLLGSLKVPLTSKLNNHSISEFNTNLVSISDEVTRVIRKDLVEYGIRLERFAITSIVVSDEDKERINKLEKKRAEGKVAIALERQHLDTVFDGNIDERTKAEALTQAINRGEGQTVVTAQPNSGFDNYLKWDWLNKHEMPVGCSVVCPHCNRTLSSAGAVYCSYCGKKIGGT